MTSIRQRMRRRPGAETADPATPPAEAQPGDVADPGAAVPPSPDAPVTTPATSAAGAAPAATPTPTPDAVAAATPAPAAAAVPGAAPPAGTPGATPADVAAPVAGSAPEHPGFATRGRLRRRLRYLRRVRELGYRDLGGLVFDQHRFARPNETLVQTKVAALAQIDGEVRALENALEDKRAIAELREAGIAACPRCGAIHGSESRYCPACGLALSGPTEMAAVHAPAPSAGGVPQAPVTPPPNPVTIAPIPAPVTPPIVGPQPPTTPPTPPTPVAVTPAAGPAPAAAPTPADAALQHTIHLRAEDDQPTTVFRAADVGAAPVASTPAPVPAAPAAATPATAATTPAPSGAVTGGDPLSGPRPAEQPDLASGDPLAPRTTPAQPGPEPESRP